MIVPRRLAYHGAMRSTVMVGVFLVTAATAAACSTSSEKTQNPDAAGSATGDAGTDATTPGGDLAPNQSGSRIKMKVITTPDGAKQFNGWRDTQRSEDCTFRLAEDGVTRCLPAVAGLLSPDPHTPNGYYADAQCQTPVVLAYTCAPPAYIAYSISGPACPVNPTSGARIGSVGATLTAAYQWSSNCQAITAPANMSFYTLGATVTPGSFQSGTEAVE